MNSPNRPHCPGKILIVKPSSLGDIVHSLPFLNILKSCYPKARIHWVVAKGLEGLLRDHPMVDELKIIHKDTWKKISGAGETIVEIRRLFQELRDEKYDLVVDLQGLLRSGLITMATRAPVRAGFAESREGSTLFYNLKVKGGREVHAVDRYLKIAEALGCECDCVISPFPLEREVPAGILELKASLGEYAVIVPGARWDTKRWPAENFGRVAAMLPLKCIVIGGKGDVPLAERVVEMSHGNAVSLAGGTSLEELIAVMRDAKIVISNDSGPMHIAAALNIPVVALFGPTSPARTGPYGRGHCVIKSDISCAPCFKKRCRDVRCMKEITVDTVIQKIRKEVLRTA